jgi:ABC-type transport system involved in cytochrome c biogenesis permease subunit
MLVLSLSFAAYLFSLWKRPLLYAGLLLQVFYVVSRGIDLGRIPLVGPHDTIAFLAASIVAFGIPFGFAIKDKDSSYFEFIASVAAVFTVFALTSKPHSGHLPPVLQTIWFECHVVLAFMSYALFGIAAVLGYMNLNKRDVLLEGLQYRAVLIGYLLFTLSMIFGGIWAYLAWGTYWVWTPKELWTSILWAYYSFYLHARLRQWWSGKAMAYLGIAGFGVVLFTYLGVSLLMKSSHSF